MIIRNKSERKMNFEEPHRKHFDKPISHLLFYCTDMDQKESYGIIKKQFPNIKLMFNFRDE